MNFKKIKKYFYILFLLIIPIVGCKENNSDVLSSQSIKNNSIAISPIKYTANPYDYVGIVHNQILWAADSLFSIDYNNRIWENVNPFDNVHQELFDVYIKKALSNLKIENEYSFNEGFNNYTNMVIDKYLIDGHVKGNISESMQYLINEMSNKCSYKDYLYTVRIFNVFKNIINNQYDITLIKDSLDEVQTDMLNEEWLQSDNVAFCALAVAVHSYDYWMTNGFFMFEQNNNGKVESLLGSAKREPIDATSLQSRRAIYGATIILSDACGAAVGGLAGGPVGAVYTGVVSSLKAGGVCGSIDFIGWVFGAWH